MFRFSRITKLKRQQARLLAEIRFLERFFRKAEVSSYYADKMMVCVSDLADVEYQIKALEQK